MLYSKISASGLAHGGEPGGAVAHSSATTRGGARGSVRGGARGGVRGAARDGRCKRRFTNQQDACASDDIK